MSRSIAIYSAETVIAASGTLELTDDILHECELIKMSVIAGSGTCKLEATPRVKGGGDGSADDEIVTGVTSGNYDTYIYSGANKFTVTETGGANSVTVILKAYRVA